MTLQPITTPEKRQARSPISSLRLVYDQTCVKSHIMASALLDDLSESVKLSANEDNPYAPPHEILPEKRGLSINGIKGQSKNTSGGLHSQSQELKKQISGFSSAEHKQHRKSNSKGHARAHSSSLPSPTTIPAQKSFGNDPSAISPETLNSLRDSSHSLNKLAASGAPPRLISRHTLEVPRVSTSRSSRDFSFPVSDTGSESGRLSPTPRTPRASNTLARPPTRSIQSDTYLEEVVQDDDMARWTESVRQKRASRRKRKEEEEDDRVLVGTKVDMNHVNWVTAYNMLTGIRFTVSRTYAKIDRELVDADFDAKHKFSFDMSVQSSPSLCNNMLMNLSELATS